MSGSEGVSKIEYTESGVYIPRGGSYTCYGGSEELLGNFTYIRE